MPSHPQRTKLFKNLPFPVMAYVCVQIILIAVNFKPTKFKVHNSSLYSQMMILTKMESCFLYYIFQGAENFRIHYWTKFDANEWMIIINFGILIKSIWLYL